MNTQDKFYRALLQIHYKATSLEEAKQLAEDAMIEYDGDPFGEREIADKQREWNWRSAAELEKEAKESA